MNSKLLKRKTEKHEIQMLNCGGGGTESVASWVRRVARGQRDMAGDQCAKL